MFCKKKRRKNSNILDVNAYDDKSETTICECEPRENYLFTKDTKQRRNQNRNRKRIEN